MKRLVSLLLALSLLALPAGAVFTDVSVNDWCVLAVDEVVHRGVMKGTSDALFSPNAPMSRGMLATVLHRSAGSPHSTAGLYFQDIETGTWYIDAVIWCAERHYMVGVDAAHFAPDLPLTREQLATALYRFVGWQTIPANTSTTFFDDAAISSWARGPVAWCVKEGLLNGKPGNRLDPQGTVTRAEMAQVMLNYFTRFDPAP